jgi:hypothetical protein
MRLLRQQGDSASKDTAVSATPLAPGRSTLVQQIYRNASGAPAGPMTRLPATTGAPLPAEARQRFEISLGTDLGAVRLHDGPESHTTARNVGAHAFTVGNDIHFGAGQLAPHHPFGFHLLAHEVAHTVQQRGGSPGAQAKLEVSQPGDAAEVEADRFADHMVHGGPAPTLSAAPAAVQRQAAPQPARAAGDLRDPRQFPTYEEFAAAFRELGTFTAHDTPGSATTGFEAFGDRAADDSSANADDHGVSRRNSRAGEAYIDHPTASWVAGHLPPELRMVVYELPADCADVAILLRHVWLYARGRTERYGSWVIGAGAGRTEAQRANHLTQLIRDDVYSGSVRAMIGAPYESRSFTVLEPILHPGDVLVWEHHDPTTHRRSGGHTQTIQTINRDDTGHITSMALLQGNQPIFAPQAAEIQNDQRSRHQGVTAESALRDLPGRRIERGTLSGNELRDVGGVWNWGDAESTTLVAAGPPSGVTRPPTRRIAGEQRRRVSDWGPSLRAASAETIEGVFEAFLMEVRSGLEGASTHATEIRTGAPDVAAIAGQRLHDLRLTADRRQELANVLIGQARSTGAHLNPAAGTNDAAVFTAIADRVRDAAGLSAPATSPSSTPASPTTAPAATPTPATPTPATPTPATPTPL